jgi:hypothetical protein
MSALSTPPHEHIEAEIIRRRREAHSNDQKPYQSQTSHPMRAKLRLQRNRQWLNTAKQKTTSPEEEENAGFNTTS